MVSMDKPQRKQSRACHKADDLPDCVHDQGFVEVAKGLMCMCHEVDLLLVPGREFHSELSLHIRHSPESCFPFLHPNKG
jgi:hypothetical protein